MSQGGCFKLERMKPLRCVEFESLEVSCFESGNFPWRIRCHIGSIVGRHPLRTPAQFSTPDRMTVLTSSPILRLALLPVNGTQSLKCRLTAWICQRNLANVAGPTNTDNAYTDSTS